MKCLPSIGNLCALNFLFTLKDEQTTGSTSWTSLSLVTSETSLPNDSKNHNEPNVWTKIPPQGNVAWFVLAGTYTIPIIGRRSTTGNSNLSK